jgi:DNA-binding NarL/FixJ family response regulator
MLSGRPRASAPAGEASAVCAHVERLARTARLSERESEVLAMLAVGADDNTIARGLCISHRTVRAHITALFMKLRLRNRTEAALAGLLTHLSTCEACLEQLAAEPRGPGKRHVHGG